MSFKPRGLATGIGSLPYLEPADAISLITSHFKEIPHWPQLPQRGKQEGFIFQFLNPLVETGLLVESEKEAFFDTSNPLWPERLADFYGLYLAGEAGESKALDRFAFPPESAKGFYAFIEHLQSNNNDEGAKYLKGQLAGPLTISFTFKDEKGLPIYYNEQLRDLIVKTLSLHARWQALTLGKFGLPVLIFVDDPGIGIYGQSSFITVTREMIKDDLKAIFEGIQAGGAMTGVHSCNACDWSILLESELLQVLSFDAYQFFRSLIPYANEIKTFLERNGTLAWGIVPTSEEVLKENLASLVDRLKNCWAELNKRGIDHKKLVSQAIITPACGTGLLKKELAQLIYKLTDELSAFLINLEAL